MKAKKWIMVVGSLVALIATGAYIWPRVSSAIFGMPLPASLKDTAAAKDSGKLAAFGKAGPTGEGPLFTEKERLAIAKELDLSKTQQDQIQKIFTTPPPKDFQDRISRLYKAEAVLTADQDAKAKRIVPQKIMERMAARRDAAKKKLSPDEFAAYDKKYQSRIQDTMAKAQAAAAGSPQSAKP